MKAEDCSALVLAGGFSSRMGRDKAELVLGGETLIERQTAKLKRLGIADIMLSGYHKELEGTRLVPDLIPHKGPLSGIHACLLAAEHRACLAVSVDVPLLPEKLLEELIEAHEGGITIACHGEGKLEPLMAVYDCSLAAAAEEILHSEKTAMMKLLKHAEVKQVRYEGDEDLLANCNTPEEFERIRLYALQERK